VDMESHFTATRKTSKAIILTAAIATTKLKANTLAEALVEARQIADYEVGAVEIRYVNDGGTVPMRTVLASRKAVAEHAAWLKARRG